MEQRIHRIRKRLFGGKALTIYLEGAKMLQHRWEKCIDLKIYYFEK